jgi:hypothetical protein
MVEFLVEIFRAVFIAGLPVAAFTLALVWWSLSRGHFRETTDSKALGLEIKRMAKTSRKAAKNKNGEDKNPQHPLQKKWAKFGGGFYGIVAFFTYIVVEIAEITTMISNFGGFIGFLQNIDLSVIIRILIDALTNFIRAMVWPVYWMERIDTNQVWIWFVVAYGGYWVGLNRALTMHQRRKAAEF